MKVVIPKGGRKNRGCRPPLMQGATSQDKLLYCSRLGGSRGGNNTSSSTTGTVTSNHIGIRRGNGVAYLPFSRRCLRLVCALS